MSRNLGDTLCEVCNSTVELCGEPHPITREEAGRYYDEYVGMVVADAECTRCSAKYLAWVKRKKWSRAAGDDRPFEDLSFRKAFNDEPAPEDLPSPEMLVTIHIEQTQSHINRRIGEIYQQLQDLNAELQGLVASPPRWESYRR
jgi:hypothetical protein